MEENGGRLDIVYKGDTSGLDKATKDASKSFDEVADSAEKASGRIEDAFKKDVLNDMILSSKVLQGSIKLNNQEVAEMTSQLRELEKAQKSATGGKAMQIKADVEALKERIAATKESTKALQEEKITLDNQILAYKQTRQAVTSMSSQMERLRNEMGQINIASQQRGRMTEQERARYAELEKQLQQLGTEYRRLTNEQKALTTGGTQWAGIISGVQGLMGAFSAASGVIGLFTDDQEKLAKTQKNMQSIMATLMGMQAVSNTLHETSSFRITTVRKITELYTASQSKLATAFGISAAAAKGLNIALMTLGGGVLIAVIAGITALISKINEERKAREEATKAAKEQARAWSEAVADTAAKQISDYRRLQAEYIKLGDNLAAKTRFIKDNQEAFDKLGVSVNGVTDADNLFIQNADAFVNALIARAQAVAATEIATEKFKEQLEKTLKAEEIGTALKTPSVLREKRIGETFLGAGKYGYEIAGLTDEQNKKLTDIIYEETSKSGLAKGREAGIAYAKGILNGLENEAENIGKQAQNLIYKSYDFENDARKALEAAGIVESTGNNDNKDSNKEAQASLDRFLKYQKDQREKARKEEIALERAAITDKEELRKFDLKQELAAIDAEKAEYAELAVAAGLAKDISEVDLSIFEKRKEIAEALYNIQTEINKKKEEETKRLKEQRELENQILTIQDKYRTAEDKIAEIRAKAAKMRAQKPESSAAIDQWERDEISKINLEALQDTQSEYYTVLFGKLEKYSVGAINKAIESAEAAIEAYTQKAKSENRALTADELKAIEMLMDAMKKAGQHTEYIAANGLKGIASGLKEAASFAALFSESLGDAINNVADIVDGVGDIKGGISDMKTAIADMKEKQGSGEKMGFADILGSVGALAGGAGVILGGITKAFSAIDSLFGWSKAEAEHQKALKELQEARLKLQREYNNALAEQNLLYKEAESIFGTKQISQAINSFRVYKEQLEQFKEELKGNSPDQKNFVQSILGLPDRRGFREQMDLYRQGLGALGEIEVVTGSKKVRSGFLGLGRKQVDVYSSLIKAYPEITKGANGFNKVLAEQILATQKMSDADKERLQQLIDLSDNYEKAKDALDDYLQSTFGSLGDSILDAIVSQVEKGTDAVEEFGKAAGDVVKKLGQQIAYELFFSDMFEKLQDDLSNVYQATDNPEEIARKQQALIEKFYQGIEGNIKEATDFYKQWTDQQDKIFGTGQQQGSASAKAIQTITQDQANSLDGKITGLQETTYGILDCSTVIRDNVSVVRSEVSFIRQSMDDLNLFSKKQLEHLAGIERNTSPLPQMAQTLKSIETNTSKL